MAATEELAKFVVGAKLDDMSPAVREQARFAIADAVGTLLTCIGEESVMRVREVASAETRDGKATVLGTNLRLAASGAAMSNGASAHALDYDSISLTVSGFIASPVLFATLAVAEEEGGVSGKRLLEAFITGWEAEAGLARGLGVHHYAKGWHSTSTLAHFGAAAGVAKLLGFNTQQVRYAFGVAASDASGIRTMIGNMVNPYHVGKAARNAIVAARLVQRGFVAHSNVLETPWGFAEVFNGRDHVDLAAITSTLGNPYDLVDPGLVIKIYPCCGLIHSGLDGVIDLVHENGIKPGDLRRARIAVHKLVPPTMQFDKPETGYQGKFSTPFCVATAISEGSVKLSHFTDERVKDPAMRALMAKVEMVVHPDLHGEDTFLLKEFTEVELELNDGRFFKRRVMRMSNKGSKGRPLKLAELKQKYLDCAADYPDAKGANEAFEMLADLESVKDIRDITKCLQR